MAWYSVKHHEQFIFCAIIFRVLMVENIPYCIKDLAWWMANWIYNQTEYYQELFIKC